MRLVFMGTPAFAVPALRALIDAGHDIACVYSQPPRPAGRGQKARPSPVQRCAEQAGLKVRTPSSLKEIAEQEAFAALRADAGVVVAYGLILPEAVLSGPPMGCLNAHASLLPRWRGAAPIERAILAGDDETGVTIMIITEELDAGPTLLARRVPIGARMTAGELHDALGALAGPLLLEALEGLSRGALAPAPQPAEGAPHAPKIDKAEAAIDWRKDACAIDRLVRALSPHPGAYFEWRGQRIKLLAASPVTASPVAASPVAASPVAPPSSGERAPGEVLDAELTLACGQDGKDALRLLTLQREGRKPAAAAAFLRGFPIPAGSRL
ncbi:MAG: methionyl-tRNA formyltransferase [Proteobacteria bacterium]|nr:methionyl-tRNA formyltransferase [Pseudomonadota bacterium]